MSAMISERSCDDAKITGSARLGRCRYGRGWRSNLYEMTRAMMNDAASQPVIHHSWRARHLNAAPVRSTPMLFHCCCCCCTSMDELLLFDGDALSFPITEPHVPLTSCHVYSYSLRSRITQFHSIRRPFEHRIY